MAEEGSHWPMHIHNSLCALSKEIVDNNGEMNRLNLKRMSENADERWESYFRMRTSLELGASEYLLATVMKEISSYGEQGLKMKNYNILDRIRGTSSNHPTNSPSWRIPKGIDDAEDYAAHLLHQGLIQMQEDHCYYCPIPSLKSYVLEHCSPSSD